MQFPMPHPRRFCRSCPCCSFLTRRASSCRPVLAQQAHQFTSITHHFDKHLISISSIKPLLLWRPCHRSRHSWSRCGLNFTLKNIPGR